MNNYQEQIDQQLESNKGKNLFYEGIGSSLHFSAAMVRAIEGIDLIDAETETVLIDYVTDRAIEAFCAINQYYRFDAQARLLLRSLYVDLFAKIRLGASSIDLIAQAHYEKLILWLQATNSFAEKLYSSKGEWVESVVCAEYSAELQLEVLQIDVRQLLEPVLDVGCGKEGRLVLFLRQNGVDAYGFDRFAFDNEALSNSDWFEFSFEKDSWGTVISNLGFSNHFQHHHFRKDGDFIAYAKRYMDILASLKIGGSFYYAPDLPFIEQYLDADRFRVTKYGVGSFGFKSTRVKRVK